MFIIIDVTGRRELMTSSLKENENHWQQTISAFHVYLQKTTELLAHKQEITKVDAPLPRNPLRAKSPKQTQVKQEVQHSDPIPVVPEDKGRTVYKPSGKRVYSSPLWVGLGDEDPVKSNNKARYKKKTK